MTDDTSLASAHLAAPLDDGLVGAVGAQGLEAHLVAADDRAASDAWLGAVARGFLDGERNDVQRETFFAGSAARRKLGLYDTSAPHPEVPVATFASWIGEVTLPGGGVVPTDAISSVTVAPTHRRRGLLRTMMAGELRTAASLGIPLAALTVSESTIYGRFGFGPAAHATFWSIDARRAGWTGPEAPGRIDFVTRERVRELAPALHERMRRATPGELEMPEGHWDRFFGLRPDAEKAGELRAVQYRSPAGEIEGIATYRVAENHDDFPASTLTVGLLLAATDDAYAGLWRFLLSMDLIRTVRAGELSVDEPLWWMIADQRAATITVADHHYLRVLDVPAVLAARTYDVTDTVALVVDDPFGIASGTFVLSAAPDGASVDLVDEPPLGVPLVRLGVAELSALVLGGVSAVTLARAGRLVADDPARVARLFAGTSVPRLSYWY